MKPHVDYFNPRSRTGSDAWGQSTSKPFDISIHAPARGATQHDINAAGYTEISIHAPARGATIFFAVLQTNSFNFNPRSRTGSDHFDILTPPACRRFQSTLPHGERRQQPKRVRNFMISIHAPARGATFSCSPFLTIGVFQSTLPHGERPADLISPKAACNISIHAPARGATLDSDCKPDMVVISIHAPARGATFKLILISRGNTFQSTLPHGERPGDT